MGVHAFGGLTPGGRAGIGCCGGESYVRGGRDSVYVVELTEHGGAPSHRSLKRTASLERAHYLHLQDRDKTAALSDGREGWSERARARARALSAPAHRAGAAFCYPLRRQCEL